MAETTLTVLKPSISGTVPTVNMTPQGFYSRYISMRIVKDVYNPDTFEITTSKDSDAIDLFKLGNVFFIHEDVNNTQLYIVEKINLKLDEKGAEQYTFSGRSYASVLDRRILYGTYSYTNKSIKYILEDMVSKSISQSDNRKISNIQFSAASDLTDTIPNIQFSDVNLLEQLNKLCEKLELTITTSYDYVTNVYSINVSKAKTLSNVLFSEYKNNIINQEFGDENKELKNYCVVAGEGEGSDRVRVTIDNSNSAKSLNLREAFVDARDLQKDTLTDAQYQTLLTERGNEKIKDMKEVTNFTSTINTNLEEYKYKADYGLGDIISVENSAWGVSKQARIVKIEEAYNEKGIEITPTFGDKPKTLKESIKKIIEEEKQNK